FVAAKRTDAVAPYLLTVHRGVGGSGAASSGALTEALLHSLLLRGGTQALTDWVDSVIAAYASDCKASGTQLETPPMALSAIGVLRAAQHMGPALCLAVFFRRHTDALDMLCTAHRYSAVQSYVQSLDIDTALGLVQRFLPVLLASDTPGSVSVDVPQSPQEDKDEGIDGGEGWEGDAKSVAFALCLSLCTQWLPSTPEASMEWTKYLLQRRALDSTCAVLGGDASSPVTHTPDTPPPRLRVDIACLVSLFLYSRRSDLLQTLFLYVLHHMHIHGETQWKQGMSDLFWFYLLESLLCLREGAAVLLDPRAAGP
ncbi:hypothetical protein KIPB_010574, partial [Kipferlia bialata]